MNPAPHSPSTNWAASTTSLLPRRSIAPRFRILTRRRIPRNVLGHNLRELFKAHGHPAVSLHRPAIFKRPGVVRVMGALQKIFEQVDGEVEVVVVHVTTIEVQLSHEL